jgi:hypothetical protein
MHTATQELLDLLVEAAIKKLNNNKRETKPCQPQSMAELRPKNNAQRPLTTNSATARLSRRGKD